MSGAIRKHTPGEWVISRDNRPGMEWNLHIASAENPNIEICSMFHDGTEENELGEANSRVIAAAPEMLDVLDAWMKASWLSGVAPVENSHDPIESLLFRTHAALSKALFGTAAFAKTEGTA